MVNFARVLLIAVLLAIAGYVFLCLLVFLLQNRLVFMPSTEMLFESAQLPIPADDMYIPVGTAERIHAWYFPASDSAPVVLFCHGNAGNISYRMEHVELFRKLGWSTLLFDYRGYGKSEGSPSETKVYEDARAAYEWLVEVKKIDPKRIIVFGESIGGAVALHTATEVPVGGLVLESTLTSARDMGRLMFRYLPVGLLLRVNFDNVGRIGKLGVPVLVTHSPVDEIVPYEMGRTLFALAPEPKLFVELSGGHNDREYVSNPQYINGLQWLAGQLPRSAKGT